MVHTCSQEERMSRTACTTTAGTPDCTAEMETVSAGGTAAAGDCALAEEGFAAPLAEGGGRKEEEREAAVVLEQV